MFINSFLLFSYFVENDTHEDHFLCLMKEGCNREILPEKQKYPARKFRSISFEALRSESISNCLSTIN